MQEKDTQKKNHQHFSLFFASEIVKFSLTQTSAIKIKTKQN